MKGWLDNFGKADNANESNVSLPEDFVGLAYNTKGRNYSPAWGGQFEYGGEIAQRGKKIDQILNANKNLDWVKGLYDPNYGSIQIPGQEGRSTHFMESADRRVYPTIRKIDGELVYLGDDAYNYADSTNSYIEFPTDRKARKFAKNYKRGTGVLDFQNGGEWLKLSPIQQTLNVVQPPSTVPYLRTKDPAEFYKAWIQNPEYARRQLLTGYSSKEDDLYMPSAAASRKERLSAIESMTPITYSKSQPSEAKPGIYGSPSYVNINPLDYIDTNKETIVAHEFAHIAGAEGPNKLGMTLPGGMSKKEREIFKQSMLPLKEPTLSGVQGSKEREASKRALEDWQHSQKEDEAKADLDALRFMMYDKGIYDITKGNKFTDEDFEKAKQSFGKDRVFKRLTDRVGKKNFINLMNIIAKGNEDVTPIAMNGASMPGAVGFTYARVAGAAPSKGKYAKKTMASAQIGKNVKKDETNIDTGIANKIAGLELKQNPEYQRLKYLQSLPQLRQAPGRGEELMRQGLGYADVATDVMQLGNFIPHPAGQAVGKVGNLAGMIVDGLQGADEAYKGNYLNAGINLASVALPVALGSKTFRRPAMNLRPGDPLYSLTEQATKPYVLNLAKPSTDYLELFTKVKKMKDNSLLFNRALLGALGAETAYDSGLIGPVKKEYGGDIPSAQTGIMSPLLLTKKILSYFYPDEEVTPTVVAAPVENQKGLTNELLKRQAYKESTFNPSAVSPAGYKGLTQIGEEVIIDYSKKKGGKKLDPFNPQDAVELQKFAMNDLYNASFINKPNQPDSVRLAKTLAAYNWGRGNLFNYLNEQKQKGVDIYGSYDWLKDLPKETSDYVNKILLQEDESFNKNYNKASTNPKYKDITSLYDKKKFGGKITTAQNGQEMRFYQNGLDWKPKNMQGGGEEDIKTIDLPEIVVTPYDEQFPFYQSLSEEEKKYINDKGPIGRGIRAIATTGKRGQTAKDISSAVRDVQQTGAEFTGIPGTIRFSDDPLKNLTGTGKTLLDLAMVAPGFGNPLSAITGPLVYGLNDGINPITGEQMFSEENLQGAFDTLDALGMATGAVTFLKQPVQLGAKTAGRFLTTKTPLRNTYRLNPFAVKEPDVILTRTQKPGQTAELRRLDELESKGLDNLNFMERYEYNQLVKSPASQAPGYGRGFSSDLGDIGYYADPYIQATRGYEGFPEILKMRLPATEAAKFNVAQNPLQGYISYAPKREFLLPKELVYSAESFTPTVGYGVGQAGARGPGSLSNFIRTVGAEQRIANTPNWLRGYPSVANKSSDLSKSFKSEIDWSKWNPDTPKYPELIKEYNKIEEATKRTGTWMKNPDGSPFQGTPEQFIQQQSSWFKKAYPQGYNQVYRGVSTNTSFPNFNESTDPVLRGPRGIFTANKELASNYVFGPQGWQQEKTILTPFDPDNTPGLFELIYPKGKQITRYQNLDDWTDIDLARTPTKEDIKYSIDNIKNQLERRKKITEELASTEGMSSIADQAKIEIKSQENRIKQLQKYYDDFDKIVNDEAEFNKMKKVLGEKTTTDDIARYIPKTNLRSITLQDLIDSGQGDVTIVNNRPGNYLKSRVGNVGFFDLKNPNVYKGIVPAGIATALSVDQQRDGGIIKDNQGYWNPDNWGQPVEIGSNNITMEGVYEPLLGISDTGDTKLMQPGKNYKFKGKKVTEFPVAELGINQLDAYPMKKLNQLLNFTNNPDKDNWLDKYN